MLTITSILSAFLMVTAFLKPRNEGRSTVPHFVVPTLGISAIFWGVIWWLGLHFVMRQRGQRLVVTRTPFVHKGDEKDEWVLKYEIIDHVWKAEGDAESVTM